MLELLSTRASVIGCFASAEALDALEGSFRVSPDEAMLVGSEVPTGPIRETIGEDGLVLDMTDGWVIWTLAGDAANEAFTYLSPVHLKGEGFTTGDVSRVPVRIVCRADRIHLMVPAMWGAYLRERILHDCADQDVRENTEPVDWEVPG